MKKKLIRCKKTKKRKHKKTTLKDKILILVTIISTFTGFLTAITEMIKLWKS